jgi:hypothetical protein
MFIVFDLVELSTLLCLYVYLMAILLIIDEKKVPLTLSRVKELNLLNAADQGSRQLTSFSPYRCGYCYWRIEMA